MVEAKQIPRGFKETEVGIIPEDWQVKKLGDIGEVKMCKRVFNHETKTQGSIPFYKIGTFGKEADAYITKDLYNKYRQKFSFPKMGDILISAAGTIGRTLIYDGKPAYFQDSNIVWIDNNEALISNKYLYYIFQVVKYNTEGGTIQRLYNSILRNTKFICSSTKIEQKAIATALNDTDELIAKLEKLIEKKRAIKQGTMQELLTPKEGWEYKTLGEICRIYGRIGFRGYTVNDIVKENEGAISLSPSNFKEGKLIFEKCTYISWSKYEESPEIKLEKGNIVLVKTASIGKTAIVKELPCKATVNPQIVVFKNITVNKLFLSYMMIFETIQKQIKDKVVGGVVPTLSQVQIASFKIPLPDKEEQNRIADLLTCMDSEIEALERKLEKYKLLKQGMMQNLLTGKIRLV